jgi:diaminohydroxyphosphoribosylaminopyrimidine deaminase/5-amino-6-(5-phosphoribosylamino)uracil reductase
MSSDEKYMSRCIELAKKGLGNTYPNPLVGSVIVHQNKIIGEGYHQKYGEAHAEVHAVNSVKDQSLLKASTIYVTLEPCAHFGKTPPCADLIIEKEIPNVVIGVVDPFEQVCGEGITRMKEHGINVKVDLLKEACTELNKRFFWNVKTDLPYIILKWAETADGFMDQDRESNVPKINWITSKSTKAITHTWRKEEAGILVGVNTILNDDPELTVREVNGNNPVRIIIDPDLKLENRNPKIFKVPGQNLIYNKLRSQENNNTEFVKLNDFSLINILSDLKKRSISSIIVEGGKFTIEQFIKENLWNEARVYVSEINFISGLNSPDIDSKYLINQHELEKEKLLFYQNSDC